MTHPKNFLHICCGLAMLIAPTSLYAQSDSVFRDFCAGNNPTISCGTIQESPPAPIVTAPTAQPAPPTPTAQPESQSPKKYYASLGAGALILERETISLTGSLTHDNNTTYANTNNGHLDFDPGASVSAIFGYHFNDWLTLEAQGFYAQNAMRLTYPAILIPSIPKLTNPTTLSGHITNYALLGQVTVSPLTIASNRPYLGAGVGVLFSQYQFDTVTENNKTSSLAMNNSRADLMLEAILGNDIRVAKNTSLGIRYQFLWTASQGTNHNDALNWTTENNVNHLLTANINYEF